jgi:putative spermidine/putrescine transport system permease protein
VTSRNDNTVQPQSRPSGQTDADSSGRRRKRNRNKGGATPWLLAPSLVLIGVVFLLPTAALLTRSMTEEPGGLTHYGAFLSSHALLTILLRSAWVALVVTAISLVVGYTVAYAAARSSGRIRTLILGAVGASLFISVVVRGYSWLTILDRQGVLNSAFKVVGLEHLQVTLVHNLTGVVIGMIQYGIPFMVLAIYDVMRRFDERLTYAAATLGARPAVAFVKVYVPLTMPGVAAGCMIVFIATLGYYILPSILGGAGNLMIGELIATKIQTTLEWGLGTAISVILLCTSLVFFWILYRVTSKLQAGVTDV